MKNKVAIMVIFPVLLIPIACFAIYLFADVESIAARVTSETGVVAEAY